MAENRAPPSRWRRVNRIGQPFRSLGARPAAPGPLRLGFVPLVHAAPLLVARELGLFARHGLAVRLSPEIGWATVREKILGGELHAAQALAPMPLAMTLGLNSAAADCLSALVLNLHGNVIVLSRRLWSATGGDTESLLTHANHAGEPLTFAIVYPHSSQQYLLTQWLRHAGLVPERHYRFVVVPPGQMVAHLKAGHLDGGCVGEPWGSLAVRAGTGVIAALSGDLARGHPEKVLLVRRAFAEERPAEHAALVRALVEACAWCAQPHHHAEVVAILAGRHGLHLPPEILRPSFGGPYPLGGGRQTIRADAVLFHGSDLNAPTPARIAWVAEHLPYRGRPELLRAVFREDLFRAAVAESPDLHTPPSSDPAHDDSTTTVA